MQSAISPQFRCQPAGGDTAADKNLCPAFPDQKWGSIFGKYLPDKFKVDIPKQQHLELLSDFLSRERVKDILVEMAMIELSTDQTQYIIGKFYMLLVQNIIFLYDIVVTDEILDNQPLLSIDIEFAKYMKVKPEKC